MLSTTTSAVNLRANSIQMIPLTSFCVSEPRRRDKSMPRPNYTELFDLKSSKYHISSTLFAQYDPSRFLSRNFNFMEIYSTRLRGPKVIRICQSWSCFRRPIRCMVSSVERWDMKIASIGTYSEGDEMNLTWTSL